MIVTIPILVAGRRRFTLKYSQTGTTDYKPVAESVRKDLEESQKEEKRQQIVARKEEIAQYYIDLNDWETELMQQGSAQYMGSMWEVCNNNNNNSILI